MGFVVLSIFQQHFVHVSTGILEELVGAVEDDEGNLTVTQHAQFIRLLHQSKLPLGEGYLSKHRVKGVYVQVLCAIYLSLSEHKDTFT